MPKKPKNPKRELPWGAGSVRYRDGYWEARWTEVDVFAGPEGVQVAL